MTCEELVHETDQPDLIHYPLLAMAEKIPCEECQGIIYIVRRPGGRDLRLARNRIRAVEVIPMKFYVRDAQMARKIHREFGDEFRELQKLINKFIAKWSAKRTDAKQDMPLNAP